MANKHQSKEGTRIKMIGKREEEVEEVIDEAGIDHAKMRVLDLLGDKERLTIEKKAKASDFKAQIDAIDAEISACAAAARSGRHKVKVEVEEWLTKGNEVIRVRTDTNERIGRRTASAEELQADMFATEPPAPATPAPAAPAGPRLVADDSAVAPASDFGGAS